jgi:hypothetical protein
MYLPYKSNTPASILSYIKTQLTTIDINQLSCVITTPASGDYGEGTITISPLSTSLLYSGNPVSLDFTNAFVPAMTVDSDKGFITSGQGGEYPDSTGNSY